MSIQIGDKFSKLTVIGKCDYKKWGKAVWQCECSCEKHTKLDIPNDILRRGTKTNCGCEPKIYKDLRGKKFGKLLVVDIARRENGKTYWKCSCDCGNYFTADQHSLVSGKCISCGCERGNKLSVNLMGNVYGTLEVIGHVRDKGWECKCTNCGKITYHDTTHLVRGIIHSDGCMRRYDDLTNKTIDNLHIKSYHHTDEKGIVHWLCDCSCGTKDIIKPAYYFHNKSVVQKSCGCKDKITNKRFLDNDLTGKTFGHWLVLEFVGNSESTGKSLWKCKCINCGKVTTVIGNNLVSGASTSCGCLCVNFAGSSSENEIKDYIATIIDDIPQKVRILDGKEIDIYYEKYDIGIEYNGSAFHASMNSLYNDKEKDYHQSKFLLAKEKGIHLINIFDVDWCKNSDKIKSYLKDLFTSPQRLYARSCKVREINKTEANLFCNLYHLQGASNTSKYCFGLYYEDELLAVMTFGRQRMKKESSTDFELIRYCVKSGYNVVGGANRLLRAFEIKYTPKHLVSYSDNDYFTGNIYTRLGFSYGGQTSLAYYWFLGDKELKREQCQTHKLKNKYPELYLKALADNAPNKEDYIMLSLGARKVYRSGNTKWEKRY